MLRMTPSVPNGVDSRFDVPLLHVLLRLALGGPDPQGAVDWSAVFALAERERLVGVTWKRSANAIRRAARPETSAQWQRQALLQGLRAERQLELVASVVKALAEEGLDPVVL